MNKELLRKVQMTQLEIAKEIKRVCEENNIKYFLDSGTLLGAVRHKGFIPWDDDMDMGMFRNDYLRFLETAPYCLSDSFFLQTWDTDPLYPYGFAKVRKIGTLFKEASISENSNHNEIWVDIFPYDTFPDGRAQRKIQGKNITKYDYAILMKKGVSRWRNHDNPVVRILVFLKYFPAKIYSLFYSAQHLQDQLNMWLTKYNNQTSEYVFGIGPIPYGTGIVHRECFEQFILMKFEDDEFAVPVGYDQYLKDLYGEYWVLPPEDERENKHKIVEIYI